MSERDVKREKYFGSVLFMKHLILATIALMIIIPIIISISLGVSNSKKARQIGSLEEKIEHLEKLSGDYYLIESKDVRVIRPQTQYSENTHYSVMFPELVVTKKDFTVSENNIYLSFISTPGDYTINILDMLWEENVKATFFFRGDETRRGYALMDQVRLDGHSLGGLSYTMNYDEIYSSVSNYLKDFELLCRNIYDATGEKINYFTYYSKENTELETILNNLNTELDQRGFVLIENDLNFFDAKDNIDDTFTFGQSYIISIDEEKADEKLVDELKVFIQELKEMGFKFDNIG